MKLGNSVGVVIPTRGRPQLVKRAVESALAQTHRELQVVVVIDGADDATQYALADVRDNRLVVAVSPQRGPAAARNVGVRMLNTDWIAFLDDDDIWLPTKIETQLRAAAICTASTPILSCRTKRLNNPGTTIEPRRCPHPGEPVSEFLFHPSGPTLSRGYIQTSTILTRRTLALAQSFDETLTLHEDWDWTLRAVQHPGSQLLLVPDILVIVDQGPTHRRMSLSTDWHYSLKWIMQRRDIVTDRAYSGFITSVVAAKAARSHAGPRDFWLILNESIRGRLSPSQIATFFIWFAIPDKLIKLMGRKSAYP